MITRTSRFTRGLIIGGIIGATVGIMNNGQVRRMRRRIMRAGRNVMNRGNGIIGAITDLF